MKITIIGVGSVGSLLSFQMATSGLVSEIVLFDINNKRSQAEALDINHAMPHYNGFCKIYATTDYEETRDSDFIVLTASIPFPVKKDAQGNLISTNREDMAEANIKLYNNIIPELINYSPDGFYIVVANPNDVIVRLISETTSIPKHRVIGTGTTIDTGRILNILSRQLNRQLHTPEIFVIGEHGDRQFIPQCYNSEKEAGSNSAFILQALNETQQIFVNKNYSTNFAISSACRALIIAIIRDDHIIMPLSSHFELDNLHGYLSMPRLITAKGIEHTIQPELNEDEIKLLKESIQAVKKYDLISH
ncbi:malate dehydrogenase [Cedecea sp. FDAARGOS_727]|uniref:malate dehydrogenase n=1 Tax=Cedecea sp. FDAARGOS_727 TaxID=2545798 RepID=UPI00143E10EE|nr:hypothetical protein [Cedecea sp. FDAARGOS_727]QIX96971.1 hypothetical protein FOC35_15330 [Cedecea sp. FDAARGOS_727]